jgi:predicted unusual protein kinase regulating ubiquinone biosynthesis (AarF/ABC1/UbiB family)
LRQFDREPLAAASIGQVHRALAHDGRELALKIQFPGISRSIESDVDNLATALQLARILPGGLDLSEILAEAKSQLRQESDYRREARCLSRYRELLRGSPVFVVPAVHEDLTTQRVLAMDLVPGVPLEDLCGPDHPQERRDRVAAELLRLVLRELFEFRFVQTDPNFANYLWLAEGERIALLDLGAARELHAPVVQFYRRLACAGMAGDRAELGRVSGSVGLLTAEDSPRRREAFLDLVELATEPFRARGAYDFGASDLPARARDQMTRLAFHHGFLRTPPPEILFVQRKLGGTFLLCARLRARVDVRALLAELGAWLEGAARPY